MKEKKESYSGTIFWTVLFHPIVLYLIWVGLSSFLRVCEFGSVKRNVVKALIVLGVCIVWFVIWLFIFFRKRKVFMAQTTKKLQWRCVLAAELLVLFGMLGVTTYQSYQYAQDMTTRLGGYLYKKEHTVSFSLEADNLYTDGYEKLFQELQEELAFPETLYVSNFVQIDFNQEGVITYLYAFLYGEAKDGNPKSYLIDYEPSKSEEVTVWLDGEAGATYASKQLLRPMGELLAKMDLKKAVTKLSGESYRLLYYGEQTAPAGGGTWYLVNEDGTLSQTDRQITGYDISLSAPKEENRTSLRFFADWTMELPESQKAAGDGTEESEEEKTQHELGVSFLDEEENRVFFLDQDTGYRLRIADAAAGSRFYVLDQTTDGGATWECINEDPFLGTLGSGADLEFLNASIGFLVLPNAGGDHSRLYRTEDGGKSYVLVELPLEEATEFDFPRLPVMTGEKLTVSIEKAMESDLENDKLTLTSEDLGATWKSE